MSWQPTGLYDDRVAAAEAAAEARRAIRRDREQAEAAALTTAGIIEDGLDKFAAQLEALGVATRRDVEVAGVLAGLRRLIRRVDPDWGRADDYGPRIGGSR